MKLHHLQIDGYKNIRDCDIDFTEPHLIYAVIGSNGSGKSNLVEAILEILIGFYFKKPPAFDFRLEFEAQKRRIVLQRKAKTAEVSVDGHRMSLSYFARRLRDGPAQVYYPELTLVYYSGECRRVQRLIDRYRRHFQILTRNPETYLVRPLFVQSSNKQAKVILLALFAHDHRELLDHLGLDAISKITITLASPNGFDPMEHEPELWNTKGLVRTVIAALNATSAAQDRHIPDIPDDTEVDGENPARKRRPPREERQYFFEREGSDTGYLALAQRLEKGGDNLYLALENLRGRGMLRSVTFWLRGRNSDETFTFDELSEGEKQLLAVVGAVQLTHQRDNLVLLDEPDTHLNPHWSWEYPSMLTESFTPEQQQRSTVLMATHDPVMISGMVREQILLAHTPTPGQRFFTRPYRHPRGQGIANILCSSEFFGLPSSLDKETQKLLDERLRISIKPRLTEEDRTRLAELNEQLEILPGVSERDPDYVDFLRERYQGRS